MQLRRANLDIVRLLVEAGADKDFADQKRKTPLQHAAGKGHIDVVRLLVEVGADKDLADKKGTVSFAL